MWQVANDVHAGGPNDISIVTAARGAVALITQTHSRKHSLLALAAFLEREPFALKVCHHWSTLTARDRKRGGANGRRRAHLRRLLERCRDYLLLPASKVVSTAEEERVLWQAAVRGQRAGRRATCARRWRANAAASVGVKSRAELVLQVHKMSSVRTARRCRRVALVRRAQGVPLQPRHFRSLEWAEQHMARRLLRYGFKTTGRERKEIEVAAEALFLERGGAPFLHLCGRLDNFVIASVNVGGNAEGHERLINFLATVPINMCCVQETSVSSRMDISAPASQYFVVGSGRVGLGKGVAVVVRHNGRPCGELPLNHVPDDDTLDELEYKSAFVEFGGAAHGAVSLYLPHGAKDSATLNDQLSELATGIINLFINENMMDVLVAGDFNVDFAQHRRSDAHARECLSQFVDELEAHGLSTRWIGGLEATSKAGYCIDHILMVARDEQVSAWTGFAPSRLHQVSDHNAVIVRLEMSLNCLEADEQAQVLAAKTPAIHRLADDEVATTFTDQVEAAIGALTSDEVTLATTQPLFLSDLLSSVALRVCGPSRVPKKTSTLFGDMHWFDVDCRRARRLVFRLERRAHRRCGDEAALGDLLEARRAFAHLCRVKKRAALDARVDEFSKMAPTAAMQRFKIWLRAAAQAGNSGVVEPAATRAGWFDTFEALPKVPNHDERMRAITAIIEKAWATDDCRVPEVTAELVRCERTHLPKHKMGGFDGLTTDAYRVLPDTIDPLLCQLFTNMIRNPESIAPLRRSIAVGLPKKPIPGPMDFRWIALFDILAKLFERVVVKLAYADGLTAAIDGETQFGFRRGVSATDAFVCMDVLRDLYYLDQETLFALSLDATKAFDRIPAVIILEQMVATPSGCASWFTRLCRHWLVGHRRTLRLGGKFHGRFITIEPSKGTPQGMVLSPPLYLFGECALTAILVDIVRRWPTSHDTPLRRLDGGGAAPVAVTKFADDKLALADSHEQFTALARGVECFNGDTDSETNVKKSATVALGVYAEIKIQIDGINVNQVEKIGMLGLNLFATPPRTKVGNPFALKGTTICHRDALARGGGALGQLIGMQWLIKKMGVAARINYLRSFVYGHLNYGMGDTAINIDQAYQFIGSAARAALGLSRCFPTVVATSCLGWMPPMTLATTRCLANAIRRAERSPSLLLRQVLELVSTTHDVGAARRLDAALLYNGVTVDDEGASRLRQLLLDHVAAGGELTRAIVTACLCAIRQSYKSSSLAVTVYAPRWAPSVVRVTVSRSLDVDIHDGESAKCRLCSDNHDYNGPALVRHCKGTEVRGIVVDAVYALSNATQGILWPAIGEQWLAEPPSVAEAIATIKGLGVRGNERVKWLLSVAMGILGYAAHRLEALVIDEYKRNKHGAHDKALRIDAATVATRKAMIDSSSVYARRGGLSSVTMRRLVDTVAQAAGPVLSGFNKTFAMVGGVVSTLKTNRIALGHVFVSATLPLTGLGVDQLPAGNVSIARNVAASATGSWSLSLGDDTERVSFLCVPVTSLGGRTAFAFFERGSNLLLAPTLPLVRLVAASDGGVRGQGSKRGVDALTAVAGVVVRDVELSSPLHVAMGVAFSGCSNNVAEAMGFLGVLEVAIGSFTVDASLCTSEHWHTLHCTLDSELVTMLVAGAWAVSDAVLLWLCNVIRQRIAVLWQLRVVVVFEHVLRASNKLADAIVNYTADLAERRHGVNEPFIWLHPSDEVVEGSLLIGTRAREGVDAAGDGLNRLPALGCGEPRELSRAEPTIAELRAAATARRRAAAKAERESVEAERRATIARERKARAEAAAAAEAERTQRRLDRARDRQVRAAAEEAVRQQRLADRELARQRLATMREHAQAERDAVDARNEKAALAMGQRREFNAMIDKAKATAIRKFECTLPPSDVPLPLRPLTIQEREREARGARIPFWRRRPDRSERIVGHRDALLRVNARSTLAGWRRYEDRLYNFVNSELPALVIAAGRAHLASLSQLHFTPSTLFTDSSLSTSSSTYSQFIKSLRNNIID